MMEQHRAMKTKDLLLHATWMNPTSEVLKEDKHKKSIFYISFI